MSGGAIPVKRYNELTLVGFWHPVMMRQVSFNAGPNFLACFECPHTGHAYSATENTNARLDVRKVDGWAPHFELANFLMIEFREFTFALVFSMWRLKDNV